MKCTNDTIRVASNIRAERGRANLTTTEVAEKLGITRQTYFKYEQNAFNITLETLMKLSNIFDCDLASFFV